MRIKQHNCLYWCHSGEGSLSRHLIEDVTKITSNVPLQVSIRQQYHSANVYFLVQESGWGNQTNWTQTKLGWRQTWGWLEPPTTDLPLFQTISWKSSGSMQNRLIREGIHARCTGWSVLSVANAKSVFESGIEKGETYVSYQAETHVSPSWKRWDTCLTKLNKRWSRHWQHCNKGHNH